IGVGLIIYRLFTLQVIEHSFYQQMMDDRKFSAPSRETARGTIYIEDRGEEDRLFPLAIDKKFQLVYAVPSETRYTRENVIQLANVLGVEQDLVDRKLSKQNDPYESLLHKAEDQLIEKVRLLGLEGVYFDEEVWRYYPAKNLFSHITGFVGYSSSGKKGLYGVEGYYDEILSKTVQVNGLNYVKKGSDIVLTIDRDVQFTACAKLKESVKKLGAKSGSVLILNPKTGAVLGLCNEPDYDPNDYQKVSDLTLYNNASIFEPYEPGSIFKAITMAAALDMNAVRPETRHMDEGFVKIGKHIIKNYGSKVYGEQTMTQVLEKSINTGAIFAAEKAGFSSFKRYVQDFGFGEKLNIDLDYEAKGDLSSLKRKSDIYLATASFGQGITVTALQMAAAYAAIANQGKLMKPFIVKKIIKPSGEIIETQPQVIRSVLNPRAAALLTGMLVSVVKNGYGKTARAPGYYLAGKTGTAQVHIKGEDGYSDKTIQSFVGFGPVDNPVFTMIIKIDEPEKSEDAGASAAPLFGEIAKFLLEYYQVPKDY
ncbi:MAG: penicillin-binding protein 2, partial [Parcubacteria group bacterium]|nr:penicillin-binding protein 2 [Parcubacteria group bacterium]